jgi:hypothetical protein
LLLLAHHDRETIVLETSDGPIEIRFSRLDSSEPRIGIDAPRAVRIIRRPTSGGDSLPPAMPSPVPEPMAADGDTGFALEQTPGLMAASPIASVTSPMGTDDREIDDWWQHPDDDPAGWPDDNGQLDEDAEFLA